MRMMSNNEVNQELKRFKDNASNRSFLIRETSNAYKCDRFLWRDEPIKGSGRFHTAAYKDGIGAVLFYGKYEDGIIIDECLQDAMDDGQIGQMPSTNV
jgi:hypothetical protein